MMSTAFPRTAIAAATLVLLPVLQGCSSEPTNPLSAAQKALSESNPRTALDLASSAIDADPASIEAKLLVAKIAMMLGNPDRAITELEHVVESSSAPSDAKAKLLEAYVAANFLNKAREVSETLPLDNAHAFLSTVNLEMAEGDFERAFELLDSGLEQFPNDPRLKTIDAERLTIQAQTEQAKRRLAEVFASDAAVPEAHILAGRLALSEGRMDEAQRQFETALDLRPAHQASMLALAAIARDRDDEKMAGNWINKANAAGQPHPIGLLFAAQMAYDAGDIERAYVLIEKSPPSFMAQPQFARLRGFIDAARGQHNLAINPLQDYLEATGGDPVARRVLAESLARNDRFEEAWDVISPLVGHPQTDGGTLLLALQLSEQTGRSDREEIERLIREKDAAPDLSEVMRQAGKAIKAGYWAEADAIYAEHLQDKGASDPALLNNAAAVKTKLGKHAEAVALARRADAAAPNTPEILDTLGWALWQQGDNPSEARALLSQALEALPKNRQIAEHWAVAHARN